MIPPLVAHVTNVFTATFACGAPTEADLLANAGNTLTTCTTITPQGAPYPVPAATGRANKVIECTLPDKTDLAGTGGQCSLSLQDQRDWGGCVDIKYVAAADDGGGIGGGGGAAPGGGDNAGGGGNNGGNPAAPQPITASPPSFPITSTNVDVIVTSATPDETAIPPRYECCGIDQGTLTVTADQPLADGSGRRIRSFRQISRLTKAFDTHNRTIYPVAVFVFLLDRTLR